VIQNERKGEEIKMKGKVLLLIVADTLFQAMASLSPLFLSAFLTFLITMTYLSPQIILMWFGDEFLIISTLFLCFWCIYGILAFLIHRYATKKSI
jgi:hypothetical protein